MIFGPLLTPGEELSNVMNDTVVVIFIYPLLFQGLFYNGSLFA